MSPVYPIRMEPVALTGNYTHMTRRDAPIWERFLRTRGELFKGVSYDVALGGRIPNLPGTSEAERLAWQYSTAAKIDVVGWRPDAVWICEVKPSASFGAIGQVLCYALLAEREEFAAVPVVPTILTDTMSEDVKYCAEALNVQVIILPEEGGVEFL